jgi:SAM-dependent methyltransferase
LDAISVQPDRSVDAVLCAWGLCYMNHELLRVQVERVLRPGGIVAFLEHRRCNLLEVRALFDQLIVQRPRYLRKAIKLNLPDDASYLVRKFCSGAMKEVHSANGKLGVTYEAPQEVREYMLKSGAAAGFLDAIEPSYREDFMYAFERLVAAQAVRVPLLHQYCMLIARKP